MSHRDWQRVQNMSRAHLALAFALLVLEILCFAASVATSVFVLATFILVSVPSVGVPRVVLGVIAALAFMAAAYGWRDLYRRVMWNE